MYYLNGKPFKTEKLYLKEWMRIIDKLKEKLGSIEVSGFDLSGVNVHKEGSQSCSMPLWLVLTIIDEAPPEVPPTDKEAMMKKYKDLWKNVARSYNVPVD